MNSNCEDLTKGAVIEALIRSINRDVVYLALNLGITGVIRDQVSLKQIWANHQVNDFIFIQLISLNERRQFEALYVQDILEDYKHDPPFYFDEQFQLTLLLKSKTMNIDAEPYYKRVELEGAS